MKVLRVNTCGRGAFGWLAAAVTLAVRQELTYPLQTNIPTLPTTPACLGQSRQNRRFLSRSCALELRSTRLRWRLRHDLCTVHAQSHRQWYIMPACTCCGRRSRWRGDVCGYPRWAHLRGVDTQYVGEVEGDPRAGQRTSCSCPSLEEVEGEVEHSMTERRNLVNWEQLSGKDRRQ